MALLKVLDPVAPLRRAVQRPVRAAFGTDRFPEEQYTDPVGDPGLFGPDSVTWRVHGDAAMLIGGISAVILQTLHPLAMAGVAEHSDWRQRPFQRLSRTSSFVTATTFGSTPVALGVIDAVRAVHLRVVGVAPDGRPYRADDPDLLAWIHVAEASSFLSGHRRYSLLPVIASDQDRYFDEVAVVAERLGAAPTSLPRSRAEVAAYFDRVRPQLVAGPQALEALRYLRVPPFRERPLQVAYRVIVQAAIGLLPEWARDMLALNAEPLRELATARVATHTLLNVLRLAGGGTPPPVRLARQRCAPVDAVRHCNSADDAEARRRGDSVDAAQARRRGDSVDVAQARRRTSESTVAAPSSTSAVAMSWPAALMPSSPRPL